MTRVKADLGACQGYANCVVAADRYFDLSDDGEVVILRAEVEEGDRAQVEAAVTSCPVNALTLVDE
ncbi:MAG TPA: ferredoxin [Nocardioidaceae bacterium]|nr:ferredoxin [Nocardioidaceae bacterium]